MAHDRSLAKEEDNNEQLLDSSPDESLKICISDPDDTRPIEQGRQVHCSSKGFARGYVSPVNIDVSLMNYYI